MSTPDFDPRRYPDPLGVPDWTWDEPTVLLHRLDEWQEGDHDTGPLIRWAAVHLRGEQDIDTAAPIHRLAYFGLGVCVGILLLAFLLAAGNGIAGEGGGREAGLASGWWKGAHSQPQSPRPFVAVPTLGLQGLVRTDILAASSGEPDHGNTRPVVGGTLRGTPREIPVAVVTTADPSLGGVPLPPRFLADVAAGRQPETTKSSPGPLSALTAEGIASHMGSGWPARYLALPIGPGYRVNLCGPAICLHVVSTDAGPSLAMQRKGRVADLSVQLFERLCGCPARFGLTVVSWMVEGREP